MVKSHLMNGKKIKAIIYDFDGTIVNTETAHLKAWQRTINDFGYKLTDLSSKIRLNMIGKKPIAIAKEIVEYLQLKISPNDLFNKKSEYLLENIYATVKLNSGIKNVLKYQKNKGYKIAIGSSGEKNYITKILTKFDLINYFDVIVTGEEINKGKPDPETYIAVINKLHLSPSECIVIEDAKNGIKAGKKAGCFCIALLTPYSVINDLIDADVIISSLSEITKFC